MTAVGAAALEVAEVSRDQETRRPGRDDALALLAHPLVGRRDRGGKAEQTEHPHENDGSGGAVQGTDRRVQDADSVPQGSDVECSRGGPHLALPAPPHGAGQPRSPVAAGSLKSKKGCR